MVPAHPGVDACNKCVMVAALWLSPGRLSGTCCRIDKSTPARADAAHLDHHRLPDFNEMRDVRGLSVEAPRRQCFQRCLVELFAIAGIPSAGTGSLPRGSPDA